jgi:hypothetical protein
MTDHFHRRHSHGTGVDIDNDFEDYYLYVVPASVAGSVLHDVAAVVVDDCAQLELDQTDIVGLYDTLLYRRYC